MSKKVVILGGFGNGVVIAEAIIHANSMGDKEWYFEGFLNDRVSVGETIESYSVLGGLSDVGRFIADGFYFINTILRIDGQEERIHLFENLHIPDEQLAIFVHPLAYISPSVKLSPGVVVMPNVSISSGVVLGRSTIVMAGASIAHNSLIGDFCHIAAQACLGACLTISRGVHIGLNASLKENICVDSFAAIGMGAVVTKDVGRKEVWVGNPAAFLRFAL